jgi:hypothetical protein
MTTEYNPTLLIEQAATARIAALQDTLRRFRHEHGTTRAGSRATTGPAALHHVEADVHRRVAGDDGVGD